MLTYCYGSTKKRNQTHFQINEVERNGFIYYPAFCKLIMRKLREDDEEIFRQELFRTLIGPKSYDEGVPAKLYNINTEYLTFDQVVQIIIVKKYYQSSSITTLFGHLVFFLNEKLETLKSPRKKDPLASYVGQKLKIKHSRYYKYERLIQYFIDSF